MNLRLLSSLGIIYSLLFLPWWATLLVCLVSIMAFPIFYEAIVWALLFDLIYHTSELPPIAFFSTMVIVGLLVVVELIRETLIFNR